MPADPQLQVPVSLIPAPVTRAVKGPASGSVDTKACALTVPGQQAASSFPTEASQQHLLIYKVSLEIIYIILRLVIIPPPLPNVIMFILGCQL